MSAILHRYFGAMFAGQLADILSRLYVRHLKTILHALDSPTTGNRDALEQRILEAFADPVMHSTLVATVDDVCSRDAARLSKPRPMAPKNRAVVRRLERDFEDEDVRVRGTATMDDAASVDIEHTDDETDASDDEDDDASSMADFIDEPEVMETIMRDFRMGTAAELDAYYNR